MSDISAEPNFTDLIASELPYLRRYTRALTGSQARGDTYTVATLEAILKDRSPFENDASANFIHQVVNCRNRLLVGRSSGIKNVFG